MKRIQTQKNVLEVLKDLEQRKQKDWWDILYVILMVYRPWQIDSQHERNRGMIGWKRNLTYTNSEKFAVIRACLNLERMGMLESRIIRVCENKEMVEKRVKLGLHIAFWKEVRLPR